MQKVNTLNTSENNLSNSGAAEPFGGLPLDYGDAFAHAMADGDAAHTIAQKRNDKMRAICSVTKNEIARAMQLCDAPEMFMSVNAMVAPRNPENYGHMKGEYIKRLVACYSDIDNYKQKIDAFTAWGEVARMVYQGRLPQPSLIALSGRGLYLRWLLRDAKPKDGQPELVGLSYFPPVDEYEGGELRHNARHEWKKVLYSQIQNAIYNRLAHLGADSNARDMTRVLRAPGSIHAGASRERGEVVRVQYYAGLDPETGMPFRYTLPELARAFSVALTEDGKPIGFGRETKAIGSAPNKRNGQIALGRKRITDYETIVRVIGAPIQGRRRDCLVALASALRIAGESREEARRAVAMAADKCQPPYPSTVSDSTIAQVVDVAYTSRKPFKYENETLCKLFGVTSENSDLMLTIKPPEEKTERTFCRKTAAAHRRAFVSTFKAQTPDASLREIATAAQDAGIECTPKTIRSDLIALGIETSAQLSLAA